MNREAAKQFLVNEDRPAVKCSKEILEDVTSRSIPAYELCFASSW
jgi:hypothetical protein